jgi:aldehyde:ferredoxin oxidoreductase
MARLFNLREGFTMNDDTLPDRMFEPLQNGALKGKALDRDEFIRARQIYYQMAGWDKEGVPISGRLAELGLSWAAPEMAPA